MGTPNYVSVSVPPRGGITAVALQADSYISLSDGNRFLGNASSQQQALTLQTSPSTQVLRTPGQAKHLSRLKAAQAVQS